MARTDPRDKKVWYESRNDTIRRLYRQLPRAVLAERFGVTVRAVETQARRLGVRKQVHRKRGQCD